MPESLSISVTLVVAALCFAVPLSSHHFVLAAAFLASPIAINVVFGLLIAIQLAVMWHDVLPAFRAGADYHGVASLNTLRFVFDSLKALALVAACIAFIVTTAVTAPAWLPVFAVASLIAYAGLSICHVMTEFFCDEQATVQALFEYDFLRIMVSGFILISLALVFFVPGVNVLVPTVLAMVAVTLAMIDVVVKQYHKNETGVKTVVMFETPLSDMGDDAEPQGPVIWQQPVPLPGRVDGVGPPLGSFSSTLNSSFQIPGNDACPTAYNTEPFVP